MLEQRILHNVPDDTNLGAPKETPEVVGEAKLSDFVIETRKISPTEEVRILDADRLKAAMGDGTISEKEIVRSTQISFGKTLAEQITQYEDRAKENPGDPTWQNELDKCRVMQAISRQPYIPMHGNCTLELKKLGDTEQAIRDIVDWLRSHDSEIRFNGEPISTDQLLKMMSDKNTNLRGGRVQVEITLDNPTLSHGLAITFYEHQLDLPPSLIFYGNPHDPLEGKTHTTADLMSALGVLNHFKQKGYTPELQMRNNPTKEGDLEVDYYAK